MTGSEQGSFLDGTQWTRGTCDDGKYAGKWYVSIGTRKHHTTFIVSEDNSTVYAIKSRGNDEVMWKAIALAVTQGFWD